MVMHRWRGYDHPTLHNMINSGPGAGASTPQTSYWEALTAELFEIDADLNSKLGELGAAWEGGAAEGAVSAMTPLQAWARDAQTGSSLMQASTMSQADNISKARAEMPEPVEVTTPEPSGWAIAGAGAAMLTGNGGPAAAVAMQAADHEHQESKQDAASQKAVDTMDTYQSSSEFNRNTLGTFTPPPDVVVSTPEPTTTAGHQIGSWNSSYSGTQSTHANTSSASYAGPSNLGQGAYTPPSGSTGHPGYTPPTGVTPTPSHYVAPQSTAANSYAPVQVNPVTPNPATTATPTGGPNSSGFSGNLPPTAGGGSSSVAGPRGGSSSLGGGGKGAAGLGSGGVGQAGEAGKGGLGRGGGAGAGSFGQSGPGATGGRGGAAGGRGGMGAGGAGAGANGEEDTEYELADYLVETEDIFGDDRIVAPSVIGETPQQ